MLAEHILRRKGRDTITIEPDAPLKDAVDALSEYDIGALVVEEADGDVVGLLSERDVVRALSDRDPGVLDHAVRSVMSTEVLTCTPQDGVKELMEVVTRRRVRHLPVLEDGELNGIISIGDLLKTRIEEVETEQEILRERLLDC
jgi:CBS domain-containing protein